MAKVLDDVLESTVDTDALDDGSTEVVQETVKPQEDDLPEKYRGKTPIMWTGI